MQLTEITGEFDFYAVYKDYMGMDRVNMPCFYNFNEYFFGISRALFKQIQEGGLKKKHYYYFEK